MNWLRKMSDTTDQFLGFPHSAIARSTMTRYYDPIAYNALLLVTGSDDVKCDSFLLRM